MSDPHPEREPDRPDPVSAVRPLLREPDSIADATDLELRLGALTDWLRERRDYVRGWLLARARERQAEDGAAPTWRIPGVTVTLTDPKPKPYVTDSDAFGRWLAARAGADPDSVDVPPGGMVELTDDVAVHARVSVGNAALADFTFAMQTTDPADRNSVAGVAEAFYERVAVDRQVIVSDDVLDRLHGAGEILVLDTGDGYDAIDGESGEFVPGVAVRPPGDATIQLRPSQATRTAVRQELDGALYPPVDRRSHLD